jgi:hypothetical protein
MKKIILSLFLIILFSGCIKQNNPIACTEEAKICPDGTAVGRIPPDCDFAPCPYTITTIPATVTNQTCIDSDTQCKEKPNGTGCTTGVWCDEYGRICGGQSCAGMGLGECYSEKCIMK